MEDIGQKDQKMAILAKNGQILTIFGQKVTNFEFSTKNEKWRILGILDIQLHEKNQINPMNEFSDLERKEERTDGRKRNHRSVAGDQKRVILGKNGKILTILVKMTNFEFSPKTKSGVF